ncbi:metallophosphoesterase [Exiguobacterium sp. SH3S2]|uniref:metallophosphoesterase family protein n=1 Tax=unclassified Exiguobacterium TaxID=2644629 RepID=UPI0010405719|nr:MULTISPECIES: metallophosphoesterase family protein [unclassified Exiguobacterium]TCI48805.1 metallophosphoesterase [Exiguobacterium sp. SH3S3]TCI63669.1 metallophosphoesterase [Exiguobacterium sp. SH3S2]TCI64792.1 metallophosphoesterase [Exiguobacterium sp. SH3S1]
MKLAILTDIHGNVQALDAVLNELDGQGIDDIWSLGDMIAMGPDSNEVMARLLDRGVKMITGNHDEAVLSLLAGTGHPESYAHTRPHHEWVARTLRPDYADALMKLPRTIEQTIGREHIYGIHYHIPTEKREASIVDEPFHDIVEATLPNMQRLFGDYAADVVCFGHHHPVHAFQDECKRYFNPGALGVAKDDLARYGVLQWDEAGLRVLAKTILYDKPSFMNKMERDEVPQREVMWRLFY